MATLVDAGPLYAAADRDDAHHGQCVELLESVSAPILVPMLVVTEVVYLVGTRLGAEAEVRFLGALAAGDLIVDHVHASDWLRIAQLVWDYRDLPLGTVDASVVVAAERRALTRLVTLDRRHLGVVRPAHVPAFELLP